MIQDITPDRLKNHYEQEQVPHREDLVVIYKDHQMLVHLCETDKTIRFPKVHELRESHSLLYLFSIGKERFFLAYSVLTGSDTHKMKNCLESLSASGFTFMNVKKIGSFVPDPQRYVFAAYTAMHLAEWYHTKQFCGACGKKLHHDSAERAMVCDTCGKKYYPRINPAVIVGVKNGEKLLLTRYREGYRHNALIAGFCEIGETLEETVEREVLEETGLHVKNITYYKSQPWGVAGDLLAGFFCEVDGDTTIHMDENELKYAEWVQREEILLQPSEYSLTNEMMKRFKDGLEFTKEY